jgi:hypothetical protein
MSETSKRVLDPEQMADIEPRTLERYVATLATEVEALEAERDAALAKLAEAERERDEAREKVRWFVEQAADEKLDGYRELGARAAAAENAADDLRARLALAEKVCEEAWRVACGCDDAPLERALNAWAEQLRAKPELAAPVYERVHTTGGLISSMPAGKPASPLRGGLGPSYTRAEVDVAIAQAKREVLEAVAQALESDRPGWKLAPELRKAASRG